MDSSLAGWGWSPLFQQAFDQEAEAGDFPARVLEEQKGAYRVAAAAGEKLARVAGRLRHQAAGREDFPAVGDWVVLDADGVITDILPRLTKISRQAAGRETQEQIIAANVDTVFIVTAHDEDFNDRRLERYVAAVKGGGAEPVVLVNKSDLGEKADLAVAARLAESYSVSAANGSNLTALAGFLSPGRTVAFVGSSGVGKSTIINALLGRALLKTGEIRASDGKGKHTTTARRLLKLDSGALIVDTPGMRELALWDGSALDEVFDDVQALALECRFSDCAHAAEKDCAVRAALADGRLEEGRFNNFLKMRKEAAYQERRQGGHAAQAFKRRAKKMMSDYKKVVKKKRGED